MSSRISSHRPHHHQSMVHFLSVVAFIFSGRTLPRAFGEIVDPTCPVLGCCEFDCCAAGTSWIPESIECQIDPFSNGFDGNFPPEYVPGCEQRSCCEDTCCGAETQYNTTVQCCVPSAPFECECDNLSYFDEVIDVFGTPVTLNGTVDVDENLGSAIGTLSANIPGATGPAMITFTTDQNILVQYAGSNLDFDGIGTGISDVLVNGIPHNLTHGPGNLIDMYNISAIESPGDVSSWDDKSVMLLTLLAVGQTQQMHNNMICALYSASTGRRLRTGTPDANLNLGGYKGTSDNAIVPFQGGSGGSSRQLWKTPPTWGCKFGAVLFTAGCVTLVAAGIITAAGKIVGAGLAWVAAKLGITVAKLNALLFLIARIGLAVLTGEIFWDFYVDEIWSV